MIWQLRRVQPGDHCEVHLTHRPRPLQLHTHHIWPLGMGGSRDKPNTVRTCPTGHANIHVNLRRLADRLPMLGSLRERALAIAGYEAWLDAGKPGGREALLALDERS